MPKSCPVYSEDLPSNTSANEHFQTVVERAYSRRGFLKSGLGLSATLCLSGPISAYGKEPAQTSPAGSPVLLGFKTIPISTDDSITVAAGYTATVFPPWGTPLRSEEHTSELQSLMRITYAVFCLKKKKKTTYSTIIISLFDKQKHTMNNKIVVNNYIS